MNHRSFQVAAQARIDGETKVYPAFLRQRPLREDDDEPTLVRARPPVVAWDECPTIVSSAPFGCAEQNPSRPVEMRMSASVETDARLVPEERAPDAYSRSLRSEDEATCRSERIGGRWHTYFDRAP